MDDPAAVHVKNCVVYLNTGAVLSCVGGARTVAADLTAEHGKGGSVTAGTTAPHAPAEHTFRVGDLAAALAIAQRKLRALINRDDALKTRVAVLGGFREAVPVEAEIELIARCHSQDLRPLRVTRQIDVGGVVGIIRDRVHAVPCRPRHIGALICGMVADVGVRRAADGVAVVMGSQPYRQMDRGFLLNIILPKRFIIFQLLVSEDQTLLVNGDSFLVLDLLLQGKNRVRRTDGQRNIFHSSERSYKNLIGRLRSGIVHRLDRLHPLLNGWRFGLLPDYGRFGLLRRVLRQCRRRQQRQAKRQNQQPAQQSFFHSTLLKISPPTAGRYPRRSALLRAGDVPGGQLCYFIVPIVAYRGGLWKRSA